MQVRKAGKSHSTLIEQRAKKYVSIKGLEGPPNKRMDDIL